MHGETTTLKQKEQCLGFTAEFDVYPRRRAAQLRKHVAYWGSLYHVRLQRTSKHRTSQVAIKNEISSQTSLKALM
jgi:hypothetical protein